MVPRDCYIDWSKSEREKQVSYISTYIWNLENWYWWPYLQGRNRDADTEDRLVDTAGAGEGGMNWESSTEIYALPYVKEKGDGKLPHNTQGAQPATLWQLEGWDTVGGERKVHREGTYINPWLIHVDAWQKPTHCKAFILQLNINNGFCFCFF